MGQFRVQIMRQSGSVFGANQQSSFSIIGKTNENLAGITETIGISNIGLMRKILLSPGFRSPSSTIEFIQQAKDLAPYLHLKNDEGHDHRFTCLDTKTINLEMPVLSLRRKYRNWIEFVPDQEGIDLLRYWNKVMVDVGDSNAVAFFTKGNQLKCRFSEGRKGPFEFPFKKNIEGKLEIARRYPADQLLRILGQYEYSKSFRIRISEDGAMWLYAESEFGLYSYLVGALWESWLEHESSHNVPVDLPDAIVDGFGRGMDVKTYIENEVGGTG